MWCLSQAAKEYGVGYRSLVKRVRRAEIKLDKLSSPTVQLYGKRGRDDETPAPKAARIQRQPARSIQAAASAPPLEHSNTTSAGKRGYRRNSAMVKKCDIIRGEKFDAWNLAFKEATLEALTEKNLDAAYFWQRSGQSKLIRLNGILGSLKQCSGTRCGAKGTASTKKKMKS